MVSFFRIYIVLIICSVSVNAQSFYGINYTVANGLAGNEVYDLFQDSKGFIWMATDKGATRFDGSSFATFNTDNGLEDNTVFSFYEDESHRVWFLLSNGTFCYVRNDSVYNYKHNALLLSQLPGKKYPRTFFIDKNGSATIGYMDAGIWDVSANGTIKPAFILPDGDKVFAGMFKGGKLSLGSVHKAYSYDRDTRKVTLVRDDKQYECTVPAGNAMNNITGLILKDSSILLAFAQSIVHYSLSGEMTHYLFDKNICALSRDKSDNVWVGFIGGGAKRVRLNGADAVTLEHVLPNRSVTNVLYDHEEGIWFSTLESGVYYQPSDHFSILNIPEAVEEVTALAANRSECLFLGTRSGRIYKSDGFSTSPFFDTQSIGGREKISILYYDTISNSLYGANISHVFRMTPNFSEYIVRAGHPKCFFRFKSKSIGFGGSNNLVFLKDNKLDKVITDCNGNSLRADAVCYDSLKDRLWVGSLDGLYYLENNCLKKIGGFSYRISSLAMHPSGVLVIGTNSRGIFLRTDTGSKHVTYQDGLTSNSVNALAIAKDGSIWAATNSGLNCILNVGTKINVKSYAVSNGVLPGKITSLVLFRGKVWFTTGDGLYYFDPHTFRPNLIPPPVLITSLAVNGSRVPTEGEIQLDYTANNIEIAFTGVSFRASQNLLFRYRINGGDWSYTRQRQLLFPNLPAGNYRFELQARNENGVWSKEAASLRFAIVAPFYSTFTFKAVVIVFAIFALYLLYLYQRNRSKERAEIQNKLAELRQQALFAQLNPHFVFNLLNSIQSFILKEDKDAAIRHISTFSKLMRLVLNTSSSKYITLKQEEEMLNMYLELNSVRFRNRFIYEVNCSGISNKMLRIPGMLVQPFVENALKHGVLNTDGPGEVVVNFTMAGERLICTISDNGVGLSKGKRLREEQNPDHVSTGMHLSCERLKLLCTEMQTEYWFHACERSNSEGGGTIISMVIPYIQSSVRLPVEGSPSSQ